MMVTGHIPVGHIPVGHFPFKLSSPQDISPSKYNFNYTVGTYEYNKL